MLANLYPHRFKIFLLSQLLLLFSTLIFPDKWMEGALYSFLFQLNILSGILLMLKRRTMMWFFIVLLVITAVIIGSSWVEGADQRTLNFIRLGIYFLFYATVTSELIKQVWKSPRVDDDVILGLISGYLSIGLIGFFICLTIEIAEPHSFSGLFSEGYDPTQLTDRFIYFSYITLLTIGYGDILPVTTLAERATILIGLSGQFYLVIITAVIVAKYIHHSNSPK